MVNFTEEDPFDPKAVWLNSEHHSHHAGGDLAARLLPIVEAAGFPVDPEKLAQITPLIQERIRLLRDVLTVGDFFFVDELPPYDTRRADSEKGRRRAGRARAGEGRGNPAHRGLLRTTASKPRCAERPKP